MAINSHSKSKYKGQNLNGIYTRVDRRSITNNNKPINIIEENNVISDGVVWTRTRFDGQYSYGGTCLHTETSAYSRED